jgi:hypothetical protein
MEMIVSEFLNTLISLQTGLDKRQMHLLFGKRMGFYSALDVQNKKIIENAILSARKRCAD